MATIRKHRGKYQVQVRRKGYPATSRSFHKLSDAKEWARHIEGQADRRELSPNRKVLERTTIAELVTRYRDEVVPRKKSATVETIILNAFLRHPICQKTLAELTPADLASYRDERLETITSKSLKRQLSPIQNMFEIAREEWGVPILTNPIERLRLVSIDRRRERRLKDGELERLIAAGNTIRNPFVIPAVLFALETAMRRGEILALRWSDVDLKRLSVTVSESKNGYSRVIPLTARAARILEQASPEDQPESSLVFPITANALKLSWKRITKRAGLGDLHFHDLRHEAISGFFELGLTAPEVASISGHRDMRMLFRYAHGDEANIRRKLIETYAEGDRRLPRRERQIRIGSRKPS